MSSARAKHPAAGAPHALPCCPAPITAQHLARAHWDVRLCAPPARSAGFETRATTRAACATQGIAQSREGQALLGIFEAAGIPPRLGFNVASREITVTLPLAVVEEELRGGTAGSEAWAPTKTLVWLMLGVHPRQAELERLYALAHGGGQPVRPTLRAATPSAHLANDCLLAFAEATRVGVVAKKVHLRLNTITVALEPTTKTTRNPNGNPDKAVLFRYAPAYLALSGLDPATTATYSQAALATAVDQFGAAFVAAFWDEMARGRYVATAALKDAVSADLLRYGKSAVAAGVYGDQSARFNPTQPLSLYLWGAAGAGKSAFVTALAVSTPTSLLHCAPAQQRSTPPPVDAWPRPRAWHVLRGSSSHNPKKDAAGTEPLHVDTWATLPMLLLCAPFFHAAGVAAGGREGAPQPGRKGRHRQDSAQLYAA